MPTHQPTLRRPRSYEHASGGPLISYSSELPVDRAAHEAVAHHGESPDLVPLPEHQVLVAGPVVRVPHLTRAVWCDNHP